MAGRRKPPLSEPPAPPPRVLVVGGGPFQLDMIRSAKALGAWVAVADRNPEAPGFMLADQPLVVDTTDVDGVVDAARAHGIAGVLTAASDAAVGAVAAVGEALGLRAVPVEAARRCRDKLETFRCLRDAELATPETVFVPGREAVRDAVAAVGGLPVVLKPRDAAGGRGVTVVKDQAALDAAFLRASVYGPGALVQRFVGGTPVGCEAFFWEGQLANAILMDDQFADGFVSPVGHSIPSTLPPDVQAQVRADVEAFAAALALSDGPANFDLRWEDDRTVLLEVNARLGGNSITDLVRCAYGVDLSAATLRAALGSDPRGDLAVDQARPSAARLVISRGGGHLRDEPETSDLEAQADVELLELTVEAGKAATLRVDDHTIVGRCLVTGESSAAAAGRAEALAAEVAARVERATG